MKIACFRFFMLRVKRPDLKLTIATIYGATELLGWRGTVHLFKEGMTYGRKQGREKEALS